MRECLLAGLVLATAGAEVVRLQDGLFYHRGPYLAHPHHLPHQARSVHPPQALYTRPHLPVRFPDAPAPVPQLQLSRPRLSAQPLLSAPALTFLDPAPPPDQPPAERTKSAALDNLMAIAGRGRGRGLEQPEAGFVCPEAEGHFRSPSSCSAYYQCAQGRPHLRRCGPGLAYDEAR